MKKAAARKSTPVEKFAFSINEFCESYGIGRTQAYEEINAGRLKIAKVGKRTLVPVIAAEAWLAAMVRAA